MSKQTTTGSSGNGARAKAIKSTTGPSAMPRATNRALLLVRDWMATRDLDIAKLSRKIDRTWDCTYNVVSGKVRPDVDAVLFFRDQAGVPVNAWAEAVK